MSILYKIKRCLKNNEKYQEIKWLLFLILFILFLLEVGSFATTDSGRRRAHIALILTQYTVMLIILLISFLIKKKWDIKIPIFLDISFVCFGFVAFILGDIAQFYGDIHYWNMLVQFLSGIVIALVGYFIINEAVNHEKISISLSPTFISIAVVMFTMSVSAVWEIGEFICDDIFLTNTQRYVESMEGLTVGTNDVPLVGHEALKDTMHDLILDLAGSVIVGFGIYTYKKREKNIKNDKRI